MPAGELYLRDVLDLPESVHAGDFKVELSGGFVDTQARVDEYVVTDQLRQAFDKALGIVRAPCARTAPTPPTCTARSAPARATS